MVGTQFLLNELPTHVMNNQKIWTINMVYDFNEHVVYIILKLE